ncbi:MAG: 2Fe-2S iron-sulfur cluster-binding protein [Pseudomonadota bacterium]
MPQIKFINADGTQHDIQANVGESVMQTAVDNGIDAILAECGGVCGCGTCHCYIDGAWLAKTGSVSAMEDMIMENVIERKDNSRLGCQITVTDEMDGMVVNLPESQY